MLPGDEECHDKVISGYLHQHPIPPPPSPPIFRTPPTQLFLTWVPFALNSSSSDSGDSDRSACGTLWPHTQVAERHCCAIFLCIWVVKYSCSWAAYSYPGGISWLPYSTYLYLGLHLFHVPFVHVFPDKAKRTQQGNLLGGDGSDPGKKHCFKFCTNTKGLKWAEIVWKQMCQGNFRAL